VEVDVEVLASGTQKVVGRAVYSCPQNCNDCNVFTGIKVYEMNALISLGLQVCYINITMLHITMQHNST
jgi:hypothetical protein